MAKRDFRMLYATRGRILRDKTRAYADLSLDELRVMRDELEQSLKIRFDMNKYNELGAIKTAIMMQSPMAIKLPKQQPRKETNNARREWHPVGIRED